MGFTEAPSPGAAFRTAQRLGPERTITTRLRRRVESFLDANTESYDRLNLITRPLIAGAVIVAVLLKRDLPGGNVVLAGCVFAMAYNFAMAGLLALRRLHLMRALSLLLDNATVAITSLWIFWRMGQEGYEADLWLIFITLIVSSSMNYGPIGSLFFTALWTGLFLYMSIAFFGPESSFRQQLPIRLVFFVLTGVISIALSAELRNRRDHLEAKTRQSLKMLAQIVEARDTDAGQHLMHIEYYSRALALRLGFDEDQSNEIAYAGMIHDVGKAQVPDAILKKAGPLTMEERQEIQQHTVWADAVLSDGEEFRAAREVARWHHERWDGTGYPDGLQGEDIPISARIVAVADVYDALISERPYKHAWPTGDAIAEIRRLSGSHFDPAIVEAFVDLYATNVLRDLDAAMSRREEHPALPPIHTVERRQAA